MLSVEDNERLARVGRGTPMGSLMRRFWIPFMVQHDLPEPDGPPVRVTLLGESLVAFRDTSGRVGLVERRCAHRRADLFFGRNEEEGLRCTYHGWKYDVTGRCVDMPTESAESTFADKVSIVAYPVRERAGVLWTYMGPKEFTPEMPEFEWANAPDANRYVSWNVQECNFAQAIEGGIDTIHSVFLHSSMDSHRRRDDWEAEGRRTNNPRLRFRTDSNPPKMQTQDTDFGIVIGARYAGDDDANYWRFNLFYMPFYTAPPGQETQKSVHAFVPLDDVTTARWTFTLSDSPMSARQRALFRKGSGLHSEVYPGTHVPTHNKSNDYQIDREMQKLETYTGIKDFGAQDYSIQEGMGPVAERHLEHLGTTDIGIIATRRRLLKAATDLREGIEPPSASQGEVYRVRPGETLIPADVSDWAAHEATKRALAAVWKS